MPDTVPSQASGLFERMRSAILTLELAPGERLTERGLEAAFAGSRTPVRAALMRLENEGLVLREGHAGRGWVVAPIDVAEIRSLAELREAVESMAVRLAVERAVDADLDAVAELLTAGGPAADEDEGLRAGSDFHVELATLSGNPLLADAVRGAMTRLARTRWLEVRTAASRAQARDEHQAIVDALRARDADRAAALVAAHIRDTNERLVHFLTAERRRLRGHGLSIVDGAPARPTRAN
ncbi:GntR family transcriptional regulator [Herbiconiux sp.]|uniref:GntR family transcriptional regulator n=1 Tax=Herbiconiux sp. TaxID=1871186 RepID=UPI0025BC11EC|nr:GntR family transcriptional regulator [Herbiconiux sp.]